LDIKETRHQQLSNLTDEIGVYALCDLDRVPIYVGQSMDGIRSRVRRHLTSARSDVIANRQLDIWEICEVWAWPMPGLNKESVSKVEVLLIREFDSQSSLVNGKLPAANAEQAAAAPEKQIVSVMDVYERNIRLDALRRLPRQMEHLNSLFSYMLEVKSNAELRRALRVHFDRLNAYYQRFMIDSGEDSVQ